MLVVCVNSCFVKKIDIKCRNDKLSILTIWHHFSLVSLEGEVTSPYCQGLASLKVLIPPPTYLELWIYETKIIK